ncbi:MAG: Nif3-like dinuclear metal center hexameric protein [Clostridiales bacterium]|jgi:dinuclear metal center YbgI/SA1388 family protein|nr:Nif3-like dinuclear metal center hexameric protein [Clostridiales bacterium]
MTVGEIINAINAIAPFSNQESWDNSGLVVGDIKQTVNSVIVALDLTEDILTQAENSASQAIITHHPPIFEPAKTFTADTLAYKAAVQGVSIIAAHTNFDAAAGGVSDTLAKTLGLKRIKSVPLPGETIAILREGRVNFETADEFARFIAKKLGGAVRFCDGGKAIKRVAVSGGSGKSFVNYVIEEGYDAFVTGEVSYDNFLEAKQKGLSIFCAGHFETENPAMTVLADLLKTNCPSLKITLGEQDTPITTVV